MDIEMSEVTDFLAAHQPFSQLPGAQRLAVARAMQMRYFRRGSTIIELDTTNDAVYLIRSGAVDLTDEHGLLIARNTTGETFGSLSVMQGAPSTYAAEAIEDTLTLVLPGRVFVELFQEFQCVADYFTPRQRGRLRRATEALQQGSAMLGLTAAELIAREPVTAPPSISIREAATLMTKHRISALMLTNGEQLAGIVTDRDMRSRVVREGIDVDQPISAVMTNNPMTIAPEATAFDLLMQMTESSVHHLPVVEHDRVLGLVSAGDVMRLETSNPVYLVGDISKQHDVPGVAAVVQRSADLAAQLMGRGANAEDISHVLTAIADAATRQLIRLFEAQLGPAPHPWAWLALGSQARRELALGSDQDHAIVVADSATDHSWYRDLADRVVGGLEACGFPRCQGEAMATRWCLSLSDWRTQFREWITAPQSDAIMHAQIFFDLRPVFGDASLAEHLRHDVIATASKTPRFLAHLAAMAVRREPPLGFFRGFVVERSGEHEDHLDIKAGGLHAIIEFARALALAYSVTETSTVGRIAALRRLEKLDQDTADDLIDAFGFVSFLRLRNHIQLTRAGERVNNFIDPDELSGAERRHLREAFAVIRQAHKVLAYQFNTHLMN